MSWMICSPALRTSFRWESRCACCHSAKVLMLGRPPHPVEGLLGDMDVVLHQRRTGEGHREGLEEDTGRVDIFEVARAESGHVDAVVGLAVNQALFLAGLLISDLRA